MADDYLPQLLRSLQEQLNHLNSKQDKQTQTLGRIEQQTIKTNGRVTQAEKDIAGLQKRIGAKWIDNLDNKVIYLIAVIFVILLILLLKQVTKINLTGLL